MSHPVSEKSALVVSAHSADFVWRAGGAIALHALQGYQVHVVCLSFGERGESAKLWRKGNMTEEAVKQVRREEAQAAAAILGASVEFFDIGDYPLRADKETLFRLADVYRRIQPHFVLTHSLHDPYNYDHPLASHLAQEARIIARAEGYRPGEKIVAAPPGLLFRTAPAGAVQLETRCVTGHHRRLGEKVSGHSVHAGSGASVGILHPRGAAARGAGQAQYRHHGRARYRSRRSLPEHLPPRNGEPGMNLINKKGLVIRHLPRHDEAVLRRCEAAGVATLHEAWDRQGLMGPAIRPIQQGVSRAGNAVTVLVTPGDNWMFHVAVEQCRAGDILVVAPTSPCGDGFFGDLLATSLQSRGVVGLVGDIGIRDSQTLREMGFAVWSRQVYAQGTVKESLGSVNVPVICAGQLVQPGDVVVADDDGVVVLPHARVRDVLHKAEARMSNELAKRERMRNGELGLDIYAMRPRLAEKGLRYYDRADEVEE